MPLNQPALPPAALPDYLPGRIHVLDASRWPQGEWVTNGVTVDVPRYGLELFVRDPDLDPDRVRWLASRTVRPIETSYVSLIHDRRLYVLRGRHLLAAHLLAGSERIPAKLFRAAAEPAQPDGCLGAEPVPA